MPATLRAEIDGGVASALARLTDAIDPHELGELIGDTVIREIPELAQRADEDLRQTARATFARGLIGVWDGVRAGADEHDIRVAHCGGVRVRP